MTQSNKVRVIILGAGAPHRGETPSALLKLGSGRLSLNWIIDALSFPNLEIHFVAGYKADAIINSFPNIKFSINTNWQKMSSTGSLLSEELDLDNTLLVSYADILFRKDIVKKLLNSKKPISIIWDSQFNHKKKHIKKHSQFQEKTQVINNKVLRLGIDLPNNLWNGAFVGLIKIEPKILKEINNFDKKIIHDLQSQHLSGLIEYLRLQGHEIEAIDVNGDWTEVIENYDIASFILGSKAKTLKRLQKMIKLSKIKEQVSFSKKDWEINSSEIINSIQYLFGKNNLIVRSSSKNEDGFDSANAGKYKSILEVKPNKKSIGNSIIEVIESFGKEVNNQDEVLVQAMISDVIASGVAFTRTLEHGSPWYVINYTDGQDTTLITSGKSKDHKTVFVIRNLDIPSNKSGWIRKLIFSLREIEELLSYDALDIEFAINSKLEVFILQVRPLTKIEKNKFTDDDFYEKSKVSHLVWNNLKISPPHIPGNPSSAYGLMPDWNPAEIIGTSPGALALSLYKYLITDEIWAQQRAEFGYRDVRPAPLVLSILGKPYVDIRLSFCSFIPKKISDSLAGKLLNFYINSLKKNRAYHDKIEFKVVPTCVTSNFNYWEKTLLNSNQFTKSEINILNQELTNITNNSFYKPKIYLKKIEELKIRNKKVKNSNLNHFEKARLLIDDCKRFGTLPFAHLARCAFVAISLLNDATSSGDISKKAKDSFLNSIRTISHEFGDDGKSALSGELDWDRYVNKYGHLRPGTYDINSERYDSNIDFYLKNSLSNKNKDLNKYQEFWGKEKKNFYKCLKKLNLPNEEKIVDNFLLLSIEGREYAKFIFTKNLSDALEEFVLAFKDYGLSRDDLSNLELNQLLKLRDSDFNKSEIIQNLKTLSSKNKENKEILSYCKLPSLIFEESELDYFNINFSIPNYIGTKIITAEFLELNENSIGNEISLEDKIILIRSADPGYDWIFTHKISGLITLYGGANSHMAIRSAEFNLSAAIGVGENIYSKLLLSKIIKIDPINKNLLGL